MPSARSIGRRRFLLIGVIFPNTLCMTTVAAVRFPIPLEALITLVKKEVIDPD
jgi:hypothetical protein